MDFNWLLDKPIAHRGFWGKGEGDEPYCAENSLTAYRRAVKKGYNIEIDVHLLPDGNFAVFHDSPLNRVCGKSGIVDNLTTEQLKDYRLSGTDDYIPTLQEVLDVVDGQVGLLIEMKNFSNKNGACEKLYEILKNYKGNYAMQSFGGAAMKWWRQNTKDIPVGILSTFPFNVMLPCWRGSIQPDFYAFDIKFLPDCFIEGQRKKCGVKLLSWTVRSRAAYDKAVDKVKVDNIIFDTFRLDEVGK